MSNLNNSMFEELLRRVRVLETTAPVGFSSVSRGALRILSPEGLIVQGSARVTGQLVGSGTFDWSGPCWLRGDTQVTGTFGVTGNTNISGSLTISGTLNVTGTATFSNNLDVSGATRLRGNTTLESDLTLTGGGAIRVGPLSIDTAGSYGGRIVSSTMQLDANSINLSANTLTSGSAAFMQNITVVGTVTAQAKSFLIPHPTKPGHELRHGCVESDHAGVIYHGTDELGADGTSTVDLPPYFEALVKQEHRTILVTGRGFAPDWGEIVDGKFQVTGTPGGLFSWQVMAERYGADFEVESPTVGPERDQV